MWLSYEGGVGVLAEATMTMQQIADAAQVTRQAVSVWRTRGQDSRHHLPPFPESLGSERNPRFRMDEVRNWFREVGVGNNHEVAEDAPLHSSLMDFLASQPVHASALLATSTLLQRPLSDVLPSKDHAGHERTPDIRSGPFAELEAIPGASGVLNQEHILAAAENRDLVEAVDTVANAAYSPLRVLRRLHDIIRERLPKGSSGSLGPEVMRALDGIFREATVAFRRTNPVEEVFAAIPRSVESTSLLAELASLRASGELPHDWLPGKFDAEESTADSSTKYALNWVAWRLLLAEFEGLEVVDTAAPFSDAGNSLIVGSWISARHADAAVFFSWVEDMVGDLSVGGAVLVIGPAELMTENLDAEAGARRLDVVAGKQGKLRKAGPLRWVASLPLRTMKHGGKRRLALWVFADDPAISGRPGRTVYSEHHDLGSTGKISALVADAAAAAAGNGAMSQHQFSMAAEIPWGKMAATDPLKVVVAPGAPSLGGARNLLTRAHRALTVSGADSGGRWFLVPSVDAVERAFDAGPRVRSWNTVVKPKAKNDRLARVLSGHRLSERLVRHGETNAMRVIGLPELADPEFIDARNSERSIERLDLLDSVKNPRETEPGDVVFTSSPRPAAWVDRVGGSVVEAPARILRLRPPTGTAMDPRVWGDAFRKPPYVLLADMVAADIRVQTNTDTGTWKVRVLPVDRKARAEMVAEAIAARRNELTTQLARLGEAEQLIFDGVTAGLLDVEEQRSGAGEAFSPRDVG